MVARKRAPVRHDVGHHADRGVERARRVVYRARPVREPPLDSGGDGEGGGRTPWVVYRARPEREQLLDRGGDGERDGGPRQGGDDAATSLGGLPATAAT